MKYFDGVLLNGWFGKLEAWALLIGAFLIVCLITAFTFGIIARFGSGEEG